MRERARSVARTLSVLWLGTAACLAAFPATVAALGGWRAAVVTGGSMAPAVHPGDVVLADPRAVPAVRAGQIVLVADPGRGGRLLTHRVSRIDADGLLVTRGDANAVEDTQHLPPAAVRGVVRLVVPLAGDPALLVAGHPDRRAVAWGAGLLLAALGARRPRVPARRSRGQRSEAG